MNENQNVAPPDWVVEFAERWSVRISELPAEDMIKIRLVTMLEQFRGLPQLRRPLASLEGIRKFERHRVKVLINEMIATDKTLMDPLTRLLTRL